MKTLPAGFVCRHAMLCSHVLIVIGFAFGAVHCQGDEMAAEIATPLQEFKVKWLDIEKKAEADTARELQTLIRKLEKISKGKNKNPKANEQATRLLEKIKAPTFLTLGLEQLMDGTHVGVSLKGAEAIADAYKQMQVTAEAWESLPGDSIVVPAGTRVDAGIDVQKGDIVLVCPHPTQKFRADSNKPWVTFDGRGGPPFQQLLARIKNPMDTRTLELKHDVLWRSSIEGRLYLETGWPRGGEGSITCKVFKVGAIPSPPRP